MDEAQLELSKNLAKFKVFNTEDEAKAWKIKQEEVTSKHMSDIGHLSDGRYFVGYSIAGELAAKAVKAAGDYYKLNIELTAGYQLGDSWAKCH